MMLLSRLELSNFKGIHNSIKIDLKPITLLFGPNSSGKSTIIQALHYAYEILERRNIDPGRTIIGGKSIDLGGFKSLVHKHNLNNLIVLRLDYDLGKYFSLPDYSQFTEGSTQDEQDIRDLIVNEVDNVWVELEVQYSGILNRPIVKGYNIGANGEVLCKVESTIDGKQVFISFINFDHPIFFKPDEDHEDSGGRLWEWADYIIKGKYLKYNQVYLPLVNMDSALPSIGYPLELDEEIWSSKYSSVYGEDYSSKNLSLLLSSFIVGPGELIRDALRKLLYLGPLRDVPSRNYVPELSPDLSRWANGLASWDILYRADDTFIDSFNHWFAKDNRLNTGYHIELKRYKELDLDNPLSLALKQGLALDEDERIAEYLDDLPVKTRFYLWDEKNGIEVLPQDIGVGISQLLPVVVAALISNRKIVAIEQPELHIHPAIQVALGDLFISRSKEFNNCFILETHSEHLLLRFLKRIRETSNDTLPQFAEPLSNADIAVYYLENDKDMIKATKLEIDETGEFKEEWPNGFFEEREEELFF